MRSVLLCIIIVAGLSTPVFGQQLKAITNSIGIKLVLIRPGSFTMGSPDGEDGRKEDETRHEVIISNWYYLGAREVSQGEYDKVMVFNPSSTKSAKNPVDGLNWHDAVSFCKELSEMPGEKAAGREYRLPTEAEWEYACRASSDAAYCFGDSAEWLGEYAWSSDNSNKRPHPVGEKKPNRWGLYDMHGSVSEWCQDVYETHSTDAVTEPHGSVRGPKRVLRGGCWFRSADCCRSAAREADDPLKRGLNRGFRVAMSLSAKQPEPASSK